MAPKSRKINKLIPNKIRTQRAGYLGMALLVLFSVLGYSIFIRPSKVKAATVGTSSDVVATGSNTRKQSVVSSTGIIVTVYNAGTTSPTGIVYSSSSDNGATWSVATQIDSVNSSDFSVAIDASNNIYIVYKDNAGLSSRKLTYSAGSWSVGASTTIISDLPCTSQSEGDTYAEPSLIATPTGLALLFRNQMVISCQNSGTEWLDYATSDFNLSWGFSNLDGYDSQGNTLSNLVADGNASWFYLGGILYVTTDSGGTYTPVPGAGVVTSTAPVLCYGLDKINMFYKNASNNLVYRNYSISTGSLSSETVISSNASDILGSITCDSYNIWVVYQSYVGTNSYNIVYKRFDGSAWDSSSTALTTDNLNNQYINTPSRTPDTATVPVFWMTGTASPYTVKTSTISTTGTVTDTGNQTGSLTGSLTGSSGDVIVKCGVWYYDTINIVSGMTVKVCSSNGQAGGTLELHANSVTIAGTIDGNGRGYPGGINVVGSGGSGGDGGITNGNDIVGTAGTSGQPGSSNNGSSGSGSFGAAGGSSGSSGTGSAGGAASIGTGSTDTGRGGSGGGGGANGSSAASLGGYLTAGVNGDSSTDESLALGSGGGAGGDGGAGGGGGGGGAGYSVTSTGFSPCPDGGAGGNGAIGGIGGKGGNGGASIKIYSTGTLSVTGSVVSAGQAGSSGGAGSTGSDGTAGVTGTC